MAHAQAQFTIRIDPDFVKRLNLFMANVQSFQASAQRAFQYRQAQVRTPPPQRPLNSVLLGVRKITRLLEKMVLTIDAITDRLINSTMGYLGKLFMRGMMAAMPFLEALIPVVGWVIGGVSFIYTIGKLAVNFIRWIYDKMIGLGEAMFRDAVLATGIGATFGGVRAFRTVFGRLPISEEIFRTAARGRGDPTSRAMGMLRVLGVKDSGDTADMLVDILIKGRRYLTRYQPNIRLPMAQAIGLEEWLGTDLVTALPQMREDELREMAREYVEAKKAMRLTPKAIEGWKTFSVTMWTIKPRIEAVIGEALANPKTGLLDAVTKLFEAVRVFIVEITKTKLADRATSIVSQWITDLADYLNSDKPYTAMKKAGVEIKRIMTSLNYLRHQMVRLLNFVRNIKKGPKTYTTIDKRGRITVHYREGDRGIHPRGMREPVGPGGEPRTRRGAGPESTGPLPSNYPAGPPGTRYDPISATSIGGGVGGDSASMGRGRHQGVDLMAPLGSPVYANMDGTIVKFGSDNFGQPTVTIRHADGTYSRYLHMQNRFGKVGDRVHGGQQIGTSGSANGTPHLHFERWFGAPNARGSRLLDPMREHGWDRRRALPRGAEPARTNPGQTPPETRTPPDARRTVPTPAPTPTPTPPAEDPSIPPVLRAPRRDTPIPTPVPTPAPPSGRRTTPTPRARPAAPAPSTTTTPTPSPTPIPRPAPQRPAPPSGRRTAPRQAPTPSTPATPTTPTRPATPTPAPAPAARAPTPASGGNAALVTDRKKFMEEIRNDPQVRDMVIAMGESEVSGQPGAQTGHIEAAMNYASAHGMTLKQHLNSRYYAPYRTGEYQRRLANVTDAQRRKWDPHFNRAFGGSDDTNLATGTASGNEDAFKSSGYFGQGPGRGRLQYLDGEWFGEEAGTRRWREAMRQKMLKSGTVQTGTPPPRPWSGEDIRKTLQPGLVGGPSGPTAYKPLGRDPEAEIRPFRQGMPGTPSGPAVPRTVSGGVSATGFSQAFPGQGLPGPNQNDQPTSRMGYDRHRLHAGGDYYTPIGTPLQAQADGKVVYVGNHNQYGTGNYGHTVVIQYDNGYTVQYSHLNPNSAKYKIGDKVSRGDVFAESGASGTEAGVAHQKGVPPPPGATPPHVHEEIVKNEHYKGGTVGGKRSPSRPFVLQPEDVQQFGPNGEKIPNTQPPTPSISSQPSNAPVNQKPLTRAPEQGDYLPSGARASPSGDAPKAVVLHTTGDRNAPAKTAESWRSEKGDRAGVGAQYIVDRDGTVHDVLAEYKYGGTGHVHPKFTPEEMKEKGLVNANFVGIEIVATNDKDMTQAQRAAVKKLIRQHYRHSQVRYHGELNPMYDPDKKGPHRPSGEGKSLADEINKERQKDPDYIEPGSAGQYLKDHLKKFEDNEDKKPSGSPDTETDRVTLAELDSGTRTDAPTLIRYNTRTGEKLPEQDPREMQKAVEKIVPGSEEDWLLRKERALQEAGPGTPEWKDAHPPRDYGPGTGLPFPGEIENEIKDLGKNKTPEIDVQPRYMDPRDIGPDWKFNPQTGRSLAEPASYDPSKSQLKIEETPTQGDESGGEAAAFLRSHFKELTAQREAGSRNLVGFAQEASLESKPITTAKGYDPGEKHIKDVEEGESFVGRLTPYAPGYGGKIEGGIETKYPAPGQPTLSEVNQTRKSLGKPTISQTEYEQTYQRAQTLDDVRLGNSSYVTIASDKQNRDQKFTIPEITYKSVIDGKTYTLKNVKAYVHDTGSAFWKPNPRPDKFDVATGDYRGQPQSKVNEMDKSPWGQEDPRDFKKGWNDEPATVDGKEIQLAKKGGVGGDAARDAQIEKELQNQKDPRHPEAEKISPTNRTQEPGNHSQNVKINKPHDADFDVVQHGPKHHHDADSSPSGGDESGSHIDTSDATGGGRIESPA